jgi:hypothetical protein
LTFDSSHLNYNDLISLINENTLTITACNQNEFSNGVVNTTLEKLQYMLTWICIKYFETVMYIAPKQISFSQKGEFSIEKYFELSEFVKAVSKLTKIDINTITINFNGIVQWDHQTTPDESRFVIDFKDENAIIGYLCDPLVSVQIGRDDGIELWKS